MEIKIAKNLREAAPHLTIGVITTTISPSSHPPMGLWEEIKETEKKLLASYSLDQVSEVPEIQALRTTYKRLGKTPSRYRGSSEALLRRILQKKGLYKVNTIVDINNLLSLESFHAVGSYDLACLKPPITFRVGNEAETYKGIGKQDISLVNLPVFFDEKGPFGSPTADSKRSMITQSTVNIMMVIISFGGAKPISQSLDYAKELLGTYAGAQQTSCFIFQ
ncbi:B3/B4 domain-containing protein (DNA/RNA-binding domain of Phe-tRNA-synthetase) [Marininema mesophilum]|uniref:B3/B4 domain-containing protein (DNA/RNA-binding domain of Phe-tRNA-synthetase) n=1 Tax=Marininema mesophilum TaxID=1048340 RepID=A0A1H2YMG7_9BACL|nr:phenylalanine--tRNA ligase beta subunit-related protein [Marininema mesophilum]SDX06175.1 B3/B4 domain-containing protein (DNA/RNA-binding domain of Phe-tRNA-synthetase) [Marininema mesophilum]